MSGFYLPHSYREQSFPNATASGGLIKFRAAWGGWRRGGRGLGPAGGARAHCQGSEWQGSLACWGEEPGHPPLGKPVPLALPAVKEPLRGLHALLFPPHTWHASRTRWEPILPSQPNVCAKSRGT